MIGCFFSSGRREEGAVGAAGPGLEACGSPAAAAGSWGDEEPVDVPGALGGVLVEEPGAVSEERACAIADGEEWEGGCAVSVEC